MPGVAHPSHVKNKTLSLKYFSTTDTVLQIIGYRKSADMLLVANPHMIKHHLEAVLLIITTNTNYATLFCYCYSLNCQTPSSHLPQNQACSSISILQGFRILISSNNNPTYFLHSSLYKSYLSASFFAHSITSFVLRESFLDTGNSQRVFELRVNL